MLGVGATAVLMPKWSSSRFWDVVTAHEITHISLMPFCINTIAGPDRPASTTLRIGVFGLIMEVLDSMLGIDVYAAYGMTETVIHATNGKPADHLPERSMGHVTPGYEFAVVDKETGELCAEGETGELWLRGTRGIQLFLEYYDNDEANAKAFDGDWFKTGDMVMLGTGGNLFYRERDKDLLKVGGENVSAREVEDVITAVPGVAQVAVVGKHHDFLDQVVVAFVVTAPGHRRGGARGRGHRGLPRASRRLQGAPGGVRRRRVPARDARQGPQEQAAGDGRRAAPRVSLAPISCVRPRGTP